MWYLPCVSRVVLDAWRTVTVPQLYCPFFALERAASGDFRGLFRGEAKGSGIRSTMNPSRRLGREATPGSVRGPGMRAEIEQQGVMMNHASMSWRGRTGDGLEPAKCCVGERECRRVAGVREAAASHGSANSKPMMARWRSGWNAGRRALCLAMLLVTGGLVARAENRVGAQEWRLLQPNHQARITSPVLTLHAIIKKPLARTGRLTVSQEASIGGQTREFKVGGLEQEHVTIDGFGTPIPPGIYHFELTDDLRPNEILTRVSIAVVAAPLDGVDLPTIDTPTPGSWFPSDVVFMRFAGISHDQIWVSIQSLGPDRRQVTFPVQPQEGSIQWISDYRWDLGSGEFQVDIYTADPAWVAQESEATTRFRVLSKPRSSPHPSLIQVDVH